MVADRPVYSLAHKGRATARPSFKGADMREEAAGSSEPEREAEERAYRETVSALAARTRAFLAELEGYRREIDRSARHTADAVLLDAAFAEVLGDGCGAGSLRRLAAAATGLLESEVREG
jgi:hypothetical protein